MSIGNHEYSYKGRPGANDPSGAKAQWAPSFSNVYDDGDGECGVATNQRFRGPANGNAIFWYSFSVGNVHVAMISSEHDPSPSAPMGAWLAEDLLSVDRAVTPWLVVAIHRPLVLAQNEPSELKMTEGLFRILEPLLLKAKVDVVLSGHVHSFFRTCPMVGKACAQPGEHGVVYYTNGAAGMSFSIDPNLPSAVMERNIQALHGYTVVETPSAKQMRLLFYGNHNNSVVDNLVINRV